MAQPQSLSQDDPRIIDSSEAFLTKNLYPLVFALIILLALACAGTWWWTQQLAQQEQALQLYTKAQTPEDWEAIIKAYPQSPAAALALIDLAQKERATGTISSAIVHYQSFLKKFSRHPAAPSVELALAVSLENAGKTAEAQTAYNKIISAKPPHAFVGAASIGLARIYLQENKLLAARQTLSDFISSNEEKGATNEAREMLNSLPPTQK
jgi:outer membrane protein assembly factor BamD (BamD/ComL family)